MKQILGLSLLITGMAMAGPRAFAGSVLEDGLKYGIHAGSHGTYLRRIQADVAKMRAEFSLRKAEFAREMQVAVLAQKRELWQARFDQLSTQALACEARLPRLNFIHISMNEIVQRCGQWLQQSRERAIEFRDLEAELEDSIELKSRLETELSNHPGSVSVREALLPLLQKLRGVVADQRSPGLSEIHLREVCSAFVQESTVVGSWTEDSTLMCQRVKIQMDYVTEKLKGLP